jgi:hypothetical protein
MEWRRNMAKTLGYVVIECRGELAPYIKSAVLHPSPDTAQLAIQLRFENEIHPVLPTTYTIAEVKEIKAEDGGA